MTDRKTELLAAIRASDDDHAKHVYADWLEEQGDIARAMLIRRQCELATLPPWERRATEARWHVDELLALHGERWHAELPAIPGVTWTTFERGFVAGARVESTAALEAYAGMIAEAAPVTRIELVSLDERTHGGIRAAVPWLRVLRVTLEGLERLEGDASLLEHVRELELETDEYPNLDALGERGPAQLERFAVVGQHTASTALVRWLAARGGSSALRRLELGTLWVDYDSGYFDDPTLRLEGARALAAAGFHGLEALDVTRQRVSSDGLEALVESLPKLRELCARGCELDHLGFLVRSHGEPFVRVDLGANAIGDAGVRALVTSPRGRAIESLALDTTELYSAGVTALAESPCWSTLRVLDLSRNPLGVGGALSLAGAPVPEHLHSLGLADIDLTAEAAGLLADVPWLGQLLAVDLSSNIVNPGLVGKLAGVRELSLAYVNGGGLTPALAPIWSQVVHLRLAGTLGLVLPAEAPELQTLDLDDCQLDTHAIARVATGAYPRLRRLVLSKNPGVKATLRQLLESELVPRLEVLDLSSCNLDGSDAERIAATDLGRIRVLDLRHNDFTESVLLRLARSETLRRVRELRLSGQPWRFAPAVRDELAERFGGAWYYHRDDVDDAE